MNIRVAWLLLNVLALASPAAALDITVTRFDDPTPAPCTLADCSLREAVILSNNLAGADRILLANGTYQLTIPGADEDGSYTGDLDVRDDLTIQGVAPAQGVSIIQMAVPQHDRVMQLYADAGPKHHLTLNYLTLTGGYALITDNQNPNYPGAGGCLRAIGRLDMDYVTLTQCEAGLGGGLYLTSYAGSTLQHVTLSSNNVQLSGGGAIIGNSNGTITLRDVTASFNSIVENPDWGSGGGLLLILTGTGHVMERIVLDNNSARRCGGGWIEGWDSGPLKAFTITNNVAHGTGGGLCLNNYSNTVLADMYDFIVSGNRADQDGGGLYIYASGFSADSVRVRLYSAQIVGNSAGYGNNGGNGGGIAFLACAACAPTANSLALIDSKVSSNDAIVFIDNVIGGTGGGVYSAQPVTSLRSRFSGNQASLRGGGMALKDAITASLIDSSTFDSNSTTASMGNIGGGGLNTNATSVTIVNSTFDANTSRYGGTLYNQEANVQIKQSTLVKGGNPAGFQGSLLYALSQSSTTFTNTLLVGTCAGLAPTAAVGDLEAGNGLTNSCNLTGSSQANLALGSLNLGTLSNNGGATPTRLPGAGSAMLGAADASQCLSLDQRGYARANASGCDVGSVQTQAIDDVLFRDGFEWIH